MRRGHLVGGGPRPGPRRQCAARRGLQRRLVDQVAARAIDEEGVRVSHVLARSARNPAAFDGGIRRGRAKRLSTAVQHHLAQFAQASTRAPVTILA